MEQALLDWLATRLPPQRGLLLGIGDDAALFEPTPGRAIMATVDVLTDQVDFRLDEIDPRQIGRKALAVNLSDLAAMAGEPRGALIGLVLPRAGALPLAQELFEGLLPLAAEWNVALAGGDTNTWDGPLVLSVTVWGETTPRGALRRDGARPGDRLLVTGPLGGSILGHHLDFVPRIAEARLLHETYTLHAGIDISDGLALDAWRVARSSGCGVVIDRERVPIADAARQLSAREGEGIEPFEHAWSDGEDFELLLAVPADEARRMISEQRVPLWEIGEVIADEGLYQRHGDGRVERSSPRGYEHRGEP